MNKAIFLSIVFSIGLSACTSPENDPAYVSEAQYSDYNCRQLKAEMNRVNAKIESTSAVNQQREILNTAVAIFALSQGGRVYQKEDVESKRLQNTYEILDRLIIKKDCQ